MEDTAAVPVFSGLGIALLLQLLGVPVKWGEAVVLGMLAAVAEAFAPRASDNIAVPAVIFLAGLLVK